MSDLPPEIKLLDEEAKQKIEKRVDDKFLDEEGKKKFEKRVEDRKTIYLSGRRKWSFIYHSFIYLSIVLSSAAAVIPQLQGVFNDTAQKNITTLVAALAAMIVGINTAGRFGEKWQTNRMSNSMVNQIEGELIADKPTKEHVKRLCQIELDHDRRITGA